MDIAPPPKPAGQPVAPAAPSTPTAAPVSVPTPSAGIPTKTTSALPVKEAPRDLDAPEPPTDVTTEQPAEAIVPDKNQPKSKPAQQSVAGIVVATIVVMIALASLAIVVYLNS